MILIIKKMDVNKINCYLFIGDLKHVHQDQKCYIQLLKEHVLKK